MNNKIIITDVLVKDVRFPTSKSLDGSDAMNPDPDYSAAYVILKTDHPDGLEENLWRVLRQIWEHFGR